MAKRNIEIKARVNLADALQVAQSLTDEYSVFTQDDTFFKVPSGRLKLRSESVGTLHLIFYNRVDLATSKTSDYRILQLDPSSKDAVLDFLEAVFGANIGKVSKKRHLFLYRVPTGNGEIVTRIHLDEVEGLGNFMELETIVEKPLAENGHANARYDQTVCQQIHDTLVQMFHIEAKDVLAGSYRDMIVDR